MLKRLRKRRSRRWKSLRKRLVSRAQWPLTTASGIHGRTLTDGERLAYFAGYLDGEGCFYSTPGGSVRIQVSNTFPYTLEQLKQRFGGSVRLRGKSNGGRAVYEWVVYGKVAMEACALLAPYLHEKRDQCSTLVAIRGSHPRSARRASLIACLKDLKKISYSEEEESGTQDPID